MDHEVDVDILYFMESGTCSFKTQRPVGRLGVIQAFVEEYGLSGNVVLSREMEIFLYNKFRRKFLIVSVEGLCDDPHNHTVSLRTEFLADHLLSDDVKEKIHRIDLLGSV